MLTGLRDCYRKVVTNMEHYVDSMRVGVGMGACQTETFDFMAPVLRYHLLKLPREGK